VLLYLTRKERDDKYDSNQLRTEPWRPNQDDRRVSKVLWSMVSKAAERSRRHRHAASDFGSARKPGSLHLF